MTAVSFTRYITRRKCSNSYSFYSLLTAPVDSHLHCPGNASRGSLDYFSPFRCSYPFLSEIYCNKHLWFLSVLRNKPRLEISFIVEPITNVARCQKLETLILQNQTCGVLTGLERTIKWDSYTGPGCA